MRRVSRLVTVSFLLTVGSRAGWSHPASASTSVWQTCETSSFVIYAVASPAMATTLGQSCEAIRHELQRKWFGNSAQASWSPRCQVVFHPSRESYSNAVGSGASRTAAASYLEVRDKKISVRRIDVCADQAGQEMAALPHELTHVVVAERFVRRRIPPWADEGMALLADTATKRQLHRHDLGAALAANTCCDVGSLMKMECCPSDAQRGAFYGQSLSLVELLVSRGGPERFAWFVERAVEVGYDRSLEEGYAIPGVAALDSLWQQCNRSDVQAVR